MSLKLISHVNGDSDLIEAWLKHYLQRGVERFHLIVHGDQEQNHKLMAIQHSYPITIEDSYGGPFHVFEKKDRLDAVLARHTGQWILLVDSDEFVEFPFADIPATIHELGLAHANVMAAPLLQRLTVDGSLETPAVIDDPFQMFPLCSADLYRKMGVKADIFKFPLFVCASGTRLGEGGNHYPPLGSEPRGAEVLGVSHHFKFRRTVSERLHNRIHSVHPWRYESVQFREYLEKHSNRLPLEGAFLYSREELFRRGLLKPSPWADPGCQKSVSVSPAQSCQEAARPESQLNGAPSGEKKSLPAPGGKKIVFVLPKASEFGGLERSLLDLLPRLAGWQLDPSIVCFDEDAIRRHLDGGVKAQIIARARKESLWGWLRTVQGAQPDIIVFLYRGIESFSWRAPAAAWLAGVRKRFSIHRRTADPLPPPVRGRSPRNLLRRLIGRRARHLLRVRLAGRLSHQTVCVSDAVRDVLVDAYGYPSRRTITVRSGVSTSSFDRSETAGAAVRARLGIARGDFVLVSTARLAESKGIDILVQAVSRVVRQGISCRCIIVGDGPAKAKLAEQANLLGLWDHIFFEGFQEDVRPYLQAEGLPLAVLEAMACGLPCIVTNVGGLAEAIQDQHAGLLVPADSVEATAEAILDLATHPEKRAEMAGMARQTACQSFDMDSRIEELKRVLLA
jgi:glycosyltransferase involved in cell wall biosynthesis